MQRRQFLSALSLLTLPMQLLAAKRRVTPADAEGPFYPVKAIPLRSHLFKDSQALKETMLLNGQVLDKTGKPLVGAKIEIWQCDKNGLYDHPSQHDTESFDSSFSGFGAQLTNEQGYYNFTTLYPAPYTGRPPHIHVKIWEKNNELLTTQLYLKGNTGGWFSSRRESLQINPKKDTNGKMTAKYTFVV